LLLWLGSLSVFGLACVGRYFGPEYGALYFFTVFPAVLFIQVIKEERKRYKWMEGFTWMIGSLSGYCLIEILDPRARLALSAGLALVIVLLIHILFGQFLTKVSRQARSI
jgi:hypothetical protein